MAHSPVFNWHLQSVVNGVRFVMCEPALRSSQVLFARLSRSGPSNWPARRTEADLVRTFQRIVIVAMYALTWRAEEGLANTSPSWTRNITRQAWFQFQFQSQPRANHGQASENIPRPKNEGYCAKLHLLALVTYECSRMTRSARIKVKWWNQMKIAASDVAQSSHSTESSSDLKAETMYVDWCFTSHPGFLSAHRWPFGSGGSRKRSLSRQVGILDQDFENTTEGDGALRLTRAFLHRNYIRNREWCWTVSCV
jgi:hypothetical protein